MHREMRRKDRGTDVERAESLLEHGQYGVLSTSGENGYAYGVPLNYIYMDGCIYFHSAFEGSKIDNIKLNNRVSFCVIGNIEPLPEKFSYRYESVIAFGQASEVFDSEKEIALISLIKKYSKDFMDKGIDYVQKSISRTRVIKINVEHLTGKAT